VKIKRGRSWKINLKKERRVENWVPRVFRS